MTRSDSQDHRRIVANFRACACCNGTRLVEGITETRPCSRCDFQGFKAWSDNRRPVSAELKGGAA